MINWQTIKKVFENLLMLRINIEIHLHKWFRLPISNELRKRQVIARRTCLKCGRTFIQKPWYKNWFGSYKWTEAQRLSNDECMPKDLKEMELKNWKKNRTPFLSHRRWCFICSGL